jgi:citrate synthase
MELQAFDAELKANREISDEIIQIISLMKNAHPMDVLRTAVSALSGPDPLVIDNSSASVIGEGVKLIAKLPTIVACHSRIRKGKEIVPPNHNLSHSANFLYMLFGSAPDLEDARLMDKDFILHAEHSINASSFAVRVVASTQADFYASITAGISALKGPLHGGAAESVMKMMLEIGREENAEQYVHDLLQSGGKLMGFGHPVYRTVDPRSIHLKNEAQALARRKGDPQWFSILGAITRTKAVKELARKGVHPNVDFWAGVSYYLLGISEDLFVSVFAIGRMPGWVAQMNEQYSAGYLIRPNQHYTGPMDKIYIPIHKRG